MCFKNLPIEFDDAGRATLKGGIPDPYSVRVSHPQLQLSEEEREEQIKRLMARNGHIRELNMDPVTRVAGALAVNVVADLENGRYLNAHSQATLFRGYEVIAMGRDPRDAVAQDIQLMIEYNPAPPFQSGSPRTAPADVVTRVAGGRQQVQDERRSIARRAAARLNEVHHA